MSQRLNAMQAAPEAYKAQLALSQFVHHCGLERSLIELVQLRASQINGCAFCINMHVKNARQHGVSDDKLNLLPAWREATVYSAREAAALAWSEALTRLGENAVPDELYAELRRHFSETEIVNLSLAIGVINTWNRLMVAFRVPPQIAAQAAA